MPDGNISVTVSDANGCSIISPIITIASPAPIAASVAITDAMCSNSFDGAIDLTPSGGTPPYTFQWDNQAAAVNEDLTNVTSGTYNVAITDAHGCTFNQSAIVNAMVTVLANAGADDTLCFTNAITLTANGGATYKWFLLPNMTFIDTAQVIVVHPAVGVNDFLMIAYQGLCSDTDTVTITILPLPATDAGADVTIIVGSSVQLNAAGGIQGSTYEWSPTVGLSDTISASPLATPKVTTTYHVKITNPSGCFATDSITITVLPTVVFPSGITPNGDGVNDEWQIDGIEAYKNCEVEVYNRWGEKLFSSPGYVDKWNGTYKGKPLPVGTYYYVINLHDEVNTENYTGPITIVR